MADILGTKHENDVVKSSSANLVVWQTFEGNRLFLQDINHQHLSNIYYYMKYVSPESYRPEVVRMIKDELATRFDDILLPYRPLRRFKQEISYLQEKGWLWPKPSGIGHNVIINGEWVGEVDESMF